MDYDSYKSGAEESLVQLEAKLGPLPETYKVKTRAGGIQYYFEYPEGYDLRNTAGRLGVGIDIRGNGGYVIAPGSFVNADESGPAGKYKVMDNNAIAELPQAWIEAIAASQKSKPKPSCVTSTYARNDMSDFITGVHFVLPDVIPAGQRNDTLFRYKGSLLYRGIPPDIVDQSVRDANTARCQPPLDDDELARILRPEDPPAIESHTALSTVDESGQPALSAASASSDSDLDRAITALNKTLFIAPEGGKVRIYREGPDPETGTNSVTPFTKEDFRLLIADKRVKIGNNEYPLADLWLKSPKARRYPDGVALLPGKEAPPGVYNSWQGWGVKPQSGNAEIALDFIRLVICNSDETVFNYVIGWLARAVQQPDKPAEVALILRSQERGTGKSTFGNMICDIFGAHSMSVRSPKHLVGNFNAHLRNTLFLFADEALFVGDRAGNDVLKGLITEPTITIERKGVDVFTVTNRLKIVMATNAEWVIPAGSDERRFLVLDVSTMAKQNTVMFGRLKRYLKKIGLAALLDYLLHYDISRFNIRSVPRTQALTDQKNRSLDPFYQWLRERLWEGRLLHNDRAWIPTQARQTLVADFVHYVEQNRLRFVDMNASHVGRRLKRLFPGIELSKRLRTGHDRARTWTFPPLEDARRAFEQHALGGDTLDWPAIDEDVA